MFADKNSFNFADMNRTVSARYFFLLATFLVLVSRPMQASDVASNTYFQERANLALREIAHRMLVIGGDTTSIVPPVRTQDGLQFIVRFPGELRYDTLRKVIDHTLNHAGLPTEYDLAIYDCVDESLILGFMARSQNGEEGYACQEREPTTTCVDMAIRFPGQGNQFAASVGWLSGIGILLGLVALGWWRNRQDESVMEQPTLSGNTLSSATLQLGACIFHTQDQKIVVAREEKVLTYREAKLLQYFCQHANKVLPREEILEAVWGDEGVQVTRSLDVFVSRLRKILKKDPSIKIASVHGVGYRLVTR